MAMGMNANAVVNDDMSNGVFSSRAESIAASTAEMPCSRFTRMDSTMTMALSTSKPSEMMSAAREI